ncbi:MAG TPA: phage holin family protein [Propioniciclava tarda]|nr:phage holin family protein [Propioniciclava tarda]HQA30954.1 phage holin family protein [Propioniciclava tarda]HQD60417.1 phage holin family protein [Propioniciclava tarda]
MADIESTVSQITSDIRTIVRGEIELAKAEVIPGVKKAGLGAGLLAGAGLVAALAVNVLFLSLGFAFTNLFWERTSPVGAFGFGFLCAAGVYLLIAAVLGVLGFLNVKKLRTPQAAMEQVSKTVDAVGGAADTGLANVRLIATRGKKVITRDETGQIVTVFSGPKHLTDRPESDAS